MGRRTLVLAACGGAFLATAIGVSAGSGVHVTRLGKGAPPTAGRAWVVKLAVRPRTFHGAAQVVASGPKRLTARARGGHGVYRARLQFPRSGVWKLTARAGGSRSGLGSIRVRAARLVFDQPTGIAATPDGSLLVVEFGFLRLVRIAPRGQVTRVAALTKPWGVAQAKSGPIFASDLGWLKRIDPGQAPTIVATADPGIEIGPIAVLPNSDVVYSTASGLYRVPGGVAGTRQQLAPQISLSSPHGIAVASNGTLLVSDTGNNLIRRIDPTSGAATTFAAIGHPRGIGVASDGTVSVVAADEHRVVRFNSSGQRLGAIGPRFGDPYALTVASDGTVYAIDAGARGFIRRIAPNGTSSVVTGP